MLESAREAMKEINRPGTIEIKIPGLENCADSSPKKKFKFSSYIDRSLELLGEQMKLFPEKRDQMELVSDLMKVCTDKLVKRGLI